MSQKVAEFEEYSLLYRRWVGNGGLEAVVDSKMQMMSTTISMTMSRLMAQADAALSDEPDQVAPLMEQLNNLIPWLGWVIAGFTMIALAIAAIAKLTGNLDNIFSFFRKYFGKAETKLSEKELAFLRQQFVVTPKIRTAARESKLKSSREKVHGKQSKKLQ